MKERLKQANLKSAKSEGIVPNEDSTTYEEAKNAIKNPDTFVHRIESSTENIASGVFLKQETVELGDGFFTNKYDLFFKADDPKLETKIITRNTPIYPHRMLIAENRKKDGPQAVGCINGAFFFLQDELLESIPEEIIYNLNIRDGKVVGLPSTDRPALITNQNGAIEALELKASGEILIGDNVYNWKGGEGLAHGYSKKEEFSDSAILFNSACCTIQYENPSDKTSLRKLRKDLNTTPKDPNVIDLVIKANQNGDLFVEKTNEDGGTDFFEGNFILQINKKIAQNIKVGDVVNPISIDGLNIKNIYSGLTTGPTVRKFKEGKDDPINHDPSLGTFPPFAADARYARSLMYKGFDNTIHMVVFDAVPRSEKMKGVTPKEAALNIPNDVVWAIFLDGGQSSRISFTTKDNNVDSRGNSQYVRLHERYKTGQGTVTEDQFLWTKRGRPLSSMIMLFKKKD